MPTLPPSAPAAPTVPDRADRATFSTRMYNFFVYLVGSFTTWLADIASNAYGNAGECYTQASTATTQAGIATTKAAEAEASATAAASAANAAAWVYGGTYALNAVAVSTLNHQSYRKVTASSVTTVDPQLDETNWVRISGGGVPDFALQSMGVI